MPKIPPLSATHAALGSAIAAARKDAQLTQEKLSDQTAINQGNLSRIENGQQEATVETMVSIADAVGVKVSDIWLSAESKIPGVVTPIRRPVKSSLPTPEQAASRTANDIGTLRTAMSALFAILARRRPDEAEEIEEALAEMSDPKYLDYEGTIQILREALRVGAKEAKALPKPRRRPKP